MNYIKFWGVRGSIPTPGPSTVRYGGNTPCVELKYGKDKMFILDAGSGIRELGQYMMKQKKPIKSNILISHLHWDHIQGLPFFTPAYIPGNEFTIHAAEEADMNLSDIFYQQMNTVNFPIQFDELLAKFKFHPLFEGTYKIDGISLDTLYLNHPGYALGYKFHVNDKLIVYISDNEPFPTYPPAPQVLDGPDLSVSQYVEDSNQRVINFIEEADYLIHDAQYTPEEYKTKYQWGHSPYDYTVKIALEANIKTLILFHHDPAHDDNFIDSILEAAKKISWQAGSNMKIIAAQEGLEISLE
jgi:phosphoribosyl 1,2-cyclic phosphodiesterase